MGEEEEEEGAARRRLVNQDMSRMENAGMKNVPSEHPLASLLLSQPLQNLFVQQRLFQGMASGEAHHSSSVTSKLAIVATQAKDVILARNYLI